MHDDTKKPFDLTLRLSDGDLAYFKQFVVREYESGAELVEALPDSFWDVASCIAENQRHGGDDFYLAYVRGFEKTLAAMHNKQRAVSDD